MKWWRDQLVINAPKFDFPIHRPFHELTREEKRLLWKGNEFFHGLDEFFKFLEGERYKIQYRVMLFSLYRQDRLSRLAAAGGCVRRRSTCRLAESISAW